MRDEAELAALMRKALDGDDRAYREFLERTAAQVRGWVRRKLAGRPAEVEDVVQEVVLAIHAKRHTWRQERPIGAWIGAIARYKIVDELRRRAPRVEVDIAGLEGILAAPEAEAVPEGLVDRALVALPPGQRSVVAAVTVEGHSIRETASRLGMTEVAVRVALHRGLAAIRRTIGGAP